jgi:hypothetical protein
VKYAFSKKLPAKVVSLYDSSIFIGFDECRFGTPTKRQVSKRQVSKRPVSKRLKR